MRRLVLLLVTFAASVASAGSFRGGTVSWEIRDVGVPRVVSFTVTTFWDEPTSDSAAVDLDFGDGMTSGALTSTVVYTGTTAALGEGFTIRQATTTHTYAADGAYTVAIAGCCRHATRNAAGTDPYRLAATVSLGTGSYGNPAALVVDPEVEAGLGALGLDIPTWEATWWGGYGIGGHISSVAESGLQSPSNTSVAFTYGPGLAWNPKNTVPGESYTISVVLDDVGGSTAMLEFVLETVPHQILSPSCLFKPAVLGAQPSATVTAMEDGFWLNDTHAPLPSSLGATLTGSDSAATLSWTPAASDDGRYGLAIDRIVDSTQHLSATCAARLHVPRATTKCSKLSSICGANTTCVDTDHGITCSCNPGYQPDNSPVACKLGSCYVQPVTCGFSHGFPVGPYCCPDPSQPTGYSCTCPLEGPGSGSGSGSDSGPPANPPGRGGCATQPGTGGLALLVVLGGIALRRRSPRR